MESHSVSETPRFTLENLCDACTAGDLGLTKEIVDSGVNPDQVCQTRRSQTPFYIAAVSKHLPIARYLFEQSCDVNKPSGTMSTPVFSSAEQGDMEMLRFLVEECKADIFIACGNEATPVYAAAEQGHADVISYLVSHGADVNMPRANKVTPLHAALFHGHVGVAEDLIRVHGANPRAGAQRGVQPIHMAARFGHTDILRLLVQEAGVPVETKGTGGDSALHFAASRNRLNAVRVLIRELGARPNASNDRGDSPVHKAASAGCTDVIRVLCGEFGANVNALNMYGATPIIHAAYPGNAETVHCLAGEFGADVNTMTLRGWDALRASLVGSQTVGHTPGTEPAEFLLNPRDYTDTHARRHSGCIAPLDMGDALLDESTVIVLNQGASFSNLASYRQSRDFFSASAGVPADTSTTDVYDASQFKEMLSCTRTEWTHPVAWLPLHPNTMDRRFVFFADPPGEDSPYVVGRIACGPRGVLAGIIEDERRVRENTDNATLGMRPASRDIITTILGSGRLRAIDISHVGTPFTASVECIMWMLHACPVPRALGTHAGAMRLRKLILRKCSLGDKGVVTAARFLCSAPGLCIDTVDLSENWAGDEGGIALAEALLWRSRELKARSHLVGEMHGAASIDIAYRTNPVSEVSLRRFAEVISARPAIVGNFTFTTIKWPAATSNFIMPAVKASASCEAALPSSAKFAFLLGSYTSAASVAAKGLKRSRRIMEKRKCPIRRLPREIVRRIAQTSVQTDSHGVYFQSSTWGAGTGIRNFTEVNIERRANTETNHFARFCQARQEKK